MTARRKVTVSSSIHFSQRSRTLANETISLWNGTTIPRLGMGCWAIGGPYHSGNTALSWGTVNDQESRKAIERALDLGIRFFDTASSYGAGHSEEILGTALKNRSDVVIATKFGNMFDPSTKQALGSSATPAFIRDSTEQSLRRLQRDSIDLLQFHINGHPIDEAIAVFDTLDELRHGGKIAAYGWSTDDPTRAEAFADRPGFVTVQHNLNVLDPAPDMIAVVERFNLVSINRGPLAMGLLSGKFDHVKLPEDDVRSSNAAWLRYFKDGAVQPEFRRKLDSVRELLRSDGRTLVQGALGWIWATSPRTLPIPGFRNVTQVEENVGALEKGALSPATMTEIKTLIGSS
ncbi:aldo/keto reductase [Rhizobium jaguaris]|uniref:Aldo/keto reductase n=1 Tax=Rhizobium jaguaris TaxID=1312183 RepID=A0A387FYN3_9HYPH|nr:aldo/keto reductase [Rhizobium jaguaris]AYG62335.1 aldo/keto reductase [Rhizobium jaguaris]